MLESDWGVVSHYNNPRDFFVQLERDLGAIEQITKSVDEFVARSTSKQGNSKFSANDFVVAKWNDDGNWYRAVIEEVYSSTNTCKVTFIDFGNSVIVSKNEIISESSEKVFKDAAVAHRCCYFSRERMKLSDWEPMLDSFKNEVNDDSRRFYIEAVGFSVSHHDVKMYTSLENKKNEIDLVSELQPAITEAPSRGVSVKSTASYASSPLVNETELGMVVYVKSVDEFYVQMNKDEAALNAAYSQLAALQSQLKPNNSSWSTDDPCIVFHSVDSCLYRGLVLSHKSGSVCVKLVDFGEIMDVSAEKVYPTDSSLLKYPPFGLQCKVAVNSQSNREVVYNILQNLVESSSTIRIKFLSDPTSPPCTVILTATGSPHVIAGDEESLPSSNGINTTHDMLPKRSDLTAGLLFHGTLVYETVETDGFFYLQTESDENKCDQVQALLDTAELKVLSSTAVRAGQSCVATYEDAFYRAVVRNIDGQGKKVFFVDFGNTELLPNDANLYEITSELKTFPPLCICCQLVGYQSFSDLPVDESGVVLPTEFEIVQGDDQVWTIRHVDGKKPPNIMRYPKTNYSSGDCFKASFSHVDPKLGNLSFCQLETSTDHLDEVANAIDSSANSLKSLATPCIGSACIAAHDDGELYRAEVTALTGKKATVRFVDFGNSRTIEVSDLKTPPPSIVAIPSLAVPILLSETQLQGVEPDSILYSLTLVSGDDENGWKVNIPEVDVSGSGDTNHCTNKQELKDNVMYAKSSITRGNHLCGYFAYVAEECSEMSYFQTPEMAEQLDHVTVSIEEIMDAMESLPLSLAVCNRPCLAQDVDDVYYRARISEQADQKATVLFVDYGTSRTVLTTDLKLIPTNLLSTPICVVPIRLNSDQASRIDMNREDYDLEVIGGDAMNGLEVAIDGVSPSNLPSNDSKNDSHQVEAATSEESVDEYKKCSQETGTKLTGYFTFVSESEGKLSHFQTFEMADKLNEKITVVIEKIEQFQDLPSTKVRIGQPCITQDVDDNYYRAMVLNNHGNEVEVMFVDYGTSRTVEADMLKVVPDELLSVPICLTPLLLTKVQASAIDLDREDYVITLVSGDEKSGWIASIEGLVSDNESFKENAAQKSDTLSIANETKRNDYVTYATRNLKENDSLTGYFTFLSDGEGLCYFQTHEMSKAAASIDDQISASVANCGPLNSSHIEVGLACLAQDVDEVFYRACVTNKLDSDLFKVTFVDYGTTRELNASLLKTAPDALLSLPSNVLPLRLTPNQQTSIDMDREDYRVTLGAGNEINGWSANIDGDKEERSTVNTDEAEATKSESVDYVGGSLQEGDQLTGYFTLLTFLDKSLCYFQTLEMLDKVDAINEQLLELLNRCEDLKPCEVKIGQACIAKDVDEVFYRALVTEKLDNDQFKVLFVDYGSSQEVSSSHMKKVPVEMLSKPINIVPLFLSSEQQETIDMDRQDYVVTLLKGDSSKGWTIELNKDSANNKVDPGLSKEDGNIEAVTLTSAALSETCQYSKGPYKVGDDFVGFFTTVSHCDGKPSYFQTPEMLVKTEVIAEKLADLVDSCEGVVSGELRIGSACLAQDVDGVFYRAVVQEIPENDFYEVLFVDYGTLGTVKIQLMKRIPKSLSEAPRNVLSLMLTTKQMDSIDMSREDYRLVLCEGDEVKGWTILLDGEKEEKQSSVAVVTVSVDSDVNEDIGQENSSLVSSPSPLKDKSQQSKYNDLGFRKGTSAVGDKLTGYFTFLSNYDDYMSYFQTEEMCKAATSIGEKMIEISSTASDISNDDVKVGLPCIAQDVDELFYRAVATKQVENAWEVLFVDYGTFGTPTSPLKKITEELLSIPMSVCPIRMNRETMSSLNVNDSYSIQLLKGDELDGWEISFEDKSSATPESHKTRVVVYPERTESVGDVKRCIALIVASNPEELSYIQSQSDELLNTKIDQTLSVDDDFVSLKSDNLFVGQACLAPHEDDGLYRAVITGIDDDVSLHFVDWGNDRRAEAGILKEVPQSILTIPSLSIPVRLTKKQMDDMDVDSVYEVKFTSGSYVTGWEIEFKSIDVSDSSTNPSTSPVKSPTTDTLSPHSPSTEVPYRYPCREEMSANFVKSSADQRNLHGAFPVAGIIIARPGTNIGPESVNTSEIVYFRSTADDNQLNEINQRLESIVSNEDQWRLPPLPPSLCVLDAACLVCEVGKNKWYRGQIVEIDAENGTTNVRLVDHGKRVLNQVPMTQLHKLPMWLRGIAPLCLACHPRDAASWEVIRCKHNVLMRLVGVDRSTGVVTASFSPHVPYSQEELLEIKQRTLASDSYGSQMITRQSLPSNDSYDSTYGTVEANVIDVTDQGYLQISLVAEYLNSRKFCDSVDSIYQLISECLIPISQPVINGAYVCRDANGQFTRVRVVSLTPTDNTCILQFLDLGHTKTLSNVHLYLLLPHLCNEESRTWLCNAFTDQPLELSQTERIHIRTILSNHTLQMRFESDNAVAVSDEPLQWWSPFRVSFPEECLTEVVADGFKTVRAILSASSNADAVKCNGHDMSTQRIPAQRISSSQHMELRVTWVDSPSSFWCRDVQSQRNIERIQGSLLASLGATTSPLDTGDETVNITIGGYYALMSSWGWRRVLILDWHDDSVKVRCVDDGQLAEVKPTSLRYLPEGAASQIPCLAMHCSLYGMKCPTGVWSDEVCDSFKKIVMETSWNAVVEQVVRVSRGHEEESMLCVSLTTTGDESSLAKHLMEMEIAIPDGIDRNLSVSSCGSVDKGIAELNDDEDVTCYIDGVSKQMNLPPLATLPNEPVEVIITNVRSCKDFSVASADEICSRKLDLKDLELPPKIQIDINASENRLIWCSMVRANQLCRVLVKLPTSEDNTSIQFDFVDEGVVVEVHKDAFLDGIHEMPKFEWLHMPRLAIKCSLFNSSGKDPSPLFKRMNDKRQLSAFVNNVENGRHVVALLDRVDGVDVSSETLAVMNEDCDISSDIHFSTNLDLIDSNCQINKNSFVESHEISDEELVETLNETEEIVETHGITDEESVEIQSKIEEIVEPHEATNEEDIETRNTKPEDFDETFPGANEEVSETKASYEQPDDSQMNAQKLAGDKVVPEGGLVSAEVEAEKEVKSADVINSQLSKDDIGEDTSLEEFVEAQSCSIDNVENDVDIPCDFDETKEALANEPNVHNVSPVIEIMNVLTDKVCTNDNEEKDQMEHLDSVAVPQATIAKNVIPVFEDENIIEEKDALEECESQDEHLGEVVIDIGESTTKQFNIEENEKLINSTETLDATKNDEGVEVELQGLTNSNSYPELLVAVADVEYDSPCDAEIVQISDEESNAACILVENLNGCPSVSVVEVSINDSSKQTMESSEKSSPMKDIIQELPDAYESFELTFADFVKNLERSDESESDQKSSISIDINPIGPLTLDIEAEDNENMNPLSSFDMRVRTVNGIAMHLYLAFVSPRCVDVVSKFRDLCEREAETGLYFIPCKPIERDGSDSHDCPKESLRGLLFSNKDINICRSINAKLVMQGVAELRPE